MQSVLGYKHEKSQDSGPLTPCPLWSVDLKLTHLDWNPEATLIHFQAQYVTICELDYKILQGAIQNVPKTKAALDVGEFCLVEDLMSARWYRGRVQNRKEDLFDVFLIDHGNVLSVDVTHVSSCSNDLLMLPPKIVSGFLANVLLLQSSCHSAVEEYFSSQLGRNITGYIQALLPHKVFLLEAPDISSDLVRHGFGRHVDMDTFFFLVELLTEAPLKQNAEPVPDLLLEKSRGQEFCFKSSSLQGYDDILSFCAPRLSCGTRAKVRVTAAVNPELFYCQMASRETDLWEMSKKLQEICEHRTKERNQKTPENLGLLCSVKHKDGKWYRGFVQFLPVNSQIRVLFIDYGFFESVKVENVHRLPPDFFSTPIMAFPCSLSGHGNVPKTQQLTFLKAGLLGAVLDVQISSFDEERHRYSITVFGIEDNDVKQPGPIQKLPTEKVEAVFEAEENSLPQGGYLYCETVIGKLMDKLLEVEEVQVDSVFVGYVGHVQHPNHFWIRTQKRNDEFQDMMTEMTDHFSQAKLNEDVLLNPELGALCCAVYEEDMHFYRGVVTDTFAHGAEILFIDFGNTEKVPHMLIKNIPETFASKSAFAMCCTLVNVFPLDDVWTSAMSDFFKQAVSNKALLVHVVQMRKNKFVVDLFEMGSDSSRSITELLVSSKQAEYMPIQPVVQHNIKMKDVTRLPEQWDDCNEENNTRENETEKSQGPANFKSLSIKPGCEFAVRCSCISSPSDFWCQPQDKALLLKELMEKVQQYYSTHTLPLQSGDLCCVAKSPQDGRWYRGLITARQTGNATVMLVDFGFTIQVSESSLQAIMPGYVCLEGQAFRCSLYNLIGPADPKNNGDWSPRASDLLKDFVLNSADGLKCQVVSQLNVTNKGLFNVVDLHNTQTKRSITNTLKEQGLARGATLSTKQPSEVFPESFVYSSYDLSPGKEEQVCVTHVDSQWEVYCHLERNCEISEELEKKISEESEKMMQANTRAVVKKLCLAKYFDGKWYRGLVHPVQSPLHLSVFFVDYGNTNILEKTNVMFIPRDSVHLLYTPMQALRCSLSSVSKKEIYADVKEWLHGAVFNKLVRAVILGKNKDGSFDVELFDGEVSINEKVKELILSLSRKPKAAVTFDMSCTKRNNKTDERRSPNSSVRCSCQPKRPSSKSPTANRGSKNKNTKTPSRGRPQKMRTRVTQQNENLKSVAPVKAHNTSQVEKPKGNQNTKSDPSEHRKESEIPQLLRLPDKNMTAGLEAKCFVSHIDSVHSFFLQLFEDEHAILKMHNSLSSSTFGDSLKTTTSLKIGDLVLAEYAEDGALYRSVVKTYEGNSSFKVEFVDYGNSAVVEKEKIYSIPKEYLSQARLSIACSLLDTSVYANDASFTDAVMEKLLTVVFVRQYGTRWKVKVEVLDGEVDLETAVETEKEEESPTSSCETENEPRSCEQNSLTEEVYKNEISEYERTASTVEGDKLTPEPPPVTMSTKVKVTAFNKKKNTRTKTSCVTVIRNYTDDFIPVKVKDTEKGIVLSVQSDGSFYVRLTRTNDLLTALGSLIADNLYKCKVVARGSIKQGLQVLVQGQDKKWQRAVVKHLNEEKCMVFLVDHGIEKEIPSGSLRQQFSDVMKIRDLAVLCKMMRCELSEEEDAHTCCETLRPIMGKEVQLVFVHYSEADNLWMIEMVLNEVMLVRQVKATPEQNEGMLLSPTESSERGSTLDTNPPQELVFAPVDADKAYCGFAAAVATPFEFCIVLDDLLLVMSKVSIMLDELPGQLSPLPEAHLVPCAGCLLKSESKKKWCRAEIVHVVDSTVVLNLVDYGHHECIPLDDSFKLKRLPAEMAELPKVAYPCVLRGVKPVGVDGQWSDDAVLFLHQCLYQRNLQIFFTEFLSNTHWKVDVLADGVHVAKRLVDAGHADYMDVVLRLLFQEQSSGVAPPRGSDSEEECGQDDEGCDDAEAPMS